MQVDEGVDEEVESHQDHCLGPRCVESLIMTDLVNLDKLIVHINVLFLL